MIITYAWPHDHNQKPNSFVARGKPCVFRLATSTLPLFLSPLLSLPRVFLSASTNDQPVRSPRKKKKKIEKPKLAYLLMKQNGIDPVFNFDHRL